MGRLELDPAALEALLSGPSSPVRAAVEDFANRVAEEVRTRGPIGFDQEISSRTPPGQLRAGMEVRQVADDRGPTVEVGTDPVRYNRDGTPWHYAFTVHEGRGPIDSVKVMSFRGPEGQFSGHHVDGAAPRPFLYVAVAEVNQQNPQLQFRTDRD